MLEQILDGIIPPIELSEREIYERISLEIHYEFYNEKLEQLKLLIGYELINLQQSLKDNELDSFSIKRLQRKIKLLKGLNNNIDSRLRHIKYIKYDFVEE